MSKDTIGDRMKRYESAPKTVLGRRTPVLMRLDGKAFHTFTRKMRRPYDPRLHGAMWAAAARLCEEIQGCRVAYVQSDEITLLLTDWGGPRTQAWFDYEVQKVVSVAAGLCSVAFYQALDVAMGGNPPPGAPCFDCRAWNLPAEEVVNAFIWRQQDAIRNSVAMHAQAHFSPRQLHGNDTRVQRAMLLELGIDWDALPTPERMGVCVVRETYPGPEDSIRHRWRVDESIPRFTEDRDYIGRYVADAPGEVLP